ncbi:MAG: hydroxymethylbilane synthase [Candidatus Ornithomonoglobus sp.]
MKIRVGSRESRLAVIQSEIIINKLKKLDPSVEVELVTMKTTGDKILDRTLDKVGGKGLFVKELDRALLDGEVDITVHSLKDMPMELERGLRIAAYSEREAANDVLILRSGETEIAGAIGCASLRRAEQLKRLYPGVEIRPVRGNVLTRLKKLDSGEYGALVLAKAGIARLGLCDRISREFSVEEIIPAAGQGIMAVEARADYHNELLDKINDENAEYCAAAERSFVRALGGGCSVPVAAYAETDGIGITVCGMDARSGEIVSCVIRGYAEDAEKLGIQLADGVRRESMMH